MKINVSGHAFKYTCSVITTSHITDEKYQAMLYDAIENLNVEFLELNPRDSGLSELVFVFDYVDMHSKDIGEVFDKCVSHYHEEILRLSKDHQVELVNN